MLPRIAYSVVVPVSAELTFRAFCDLNRLLDRGVYDEVSWIEGNPWQVGSRIRYVVSKPVKATISAVVTSCEPPRFVALLNHAIGVTADQQVTFAASSNAGTSVRMIVDFVGQSPDLPDVVVQQAITFYTRDALDTMAALCRK
ncbi:MAG: hypothetical protein WAQ52_15375 [Terriglobales bacterium]